MLMCHLVADGRTHLPSGLASTEFPLPHLPNSANPGRYLAGRLTGKLDTEIRLSRACGRRATKVTRVEEPTFVMHHVIESVLTVCDRLDYD